MTKHSGIAPPFTRLARQIAGEVHTDPLRRYMLATDGSIFCKQPAAVIYPRRTADVQAALRFASAHHLAVHPRGAGSGLSGAALGDGVVIDFSKYMHRLLNLDLQRGWFECEPGYRLGELQAALKDQRLFFPPDPSSGEYASFGGMCATNASGAHSAKYGNVADYLLDAELVFADGTCAWLNALQEQPLEQLPDYLQRLAKLYLKHAPLIEKAYPPIACNVAGYNLRGLVQNGRLVLHRLLCGAEGTLAVVTRLRLRLIPRPAADSLVVAYFDTIVQAARAVQMAMLLKPSGIEVMDKSLLRIARESDDLLRRSIPADVDNVLLMEFDGPTRESCARPAEAILRQMQEAGLNRQAHLAVSAQEKEKFWTLRKAAVPILYKLKGRRKILALVEDSAVPVDKLVPYFEGIYGIFKRLQVDFVLYGHIAKGLMHTRPLLDLKDPHDVALLQPIADEVFELVNSLDGTVSGEHGDGRLRSAYLQRKYPQIYALFGQVKKLFDPQRTLNPEIKTTCRPDQMSCDLRYGARYTAFDLPGKHLHWGQAFMEEVERCHGCSQCTTLTTAARMCPVYKFTRDEAAAPKAKANVLRALISGKVHRRSLYSRILQHVMAQCVNCGSCYMECPSNVNIPKLAMEAKAQYARRFGLPRAERLTAHVEEAARGLHKLAPVVEPMVRREPIKRLAARLGGLAAERDMVVFAKRSLYERMPQHIPGSGSAVLFFAGCYAGFIRPELGQAAIGVLNRLGMQVHLPPQFCCGLPQLSKGLADAARGKVHRNLAAWQDLLPRVDHIVVTCSSCGYALMQDWRYLIDEAGAAKVRAKTVHISHLLEQNRARLPLGRLDRTLGYHHPCHLRIQPHADSSLKLLAAIPGAALHDLQSHCCGMAGSWGLIAKNYPLSRTIAGPMIQRLQQSGADWAVTDCPTCQMQMEHLGGLPVRHPVEVIWRSLQSRL